MSRIEYWIALAVIVAGLLLTATACGGGQAPTDSATTDATSSDADVITVPLPDGRSVYCVVYDDSKPGTELSCGWELVK